MEVDSSDGHVQRARAGPHGGHQRGEQRQPVLRVAQRQGADGSGEAGVGRGLRRLRGAADVTSRDDVTKAMGWAASRLSEVEQGHGTLTKAEADRLLRLYKVTGDQAVELRGLAAAARRRGTYGKVPEFARGYIGVEVGACPDVTAVRDSRNPEQTPLAFTSAEWAAFVTDVRLDAFAG